MKDDFEGSSLLIRVAAGVLIAGLVITTVAPLVGILKNSAGNGEVLVQEKLSKVPVFTVTDSTGRPYMSESEDHRSRNGFFFLQPKDAQQYLETVKADNVDAKVLAISMDRVLKYLETRSSPAKSIPEFFQLFGDDHEQQLANDISGGTFQKAYGKYGVPVFYIEGMAFSNNEGTGTIIPLFFEKERLDAALVDLKQNNPDATLKAEDTQIVDLMQTISEIRTGADTRFQKVVFIPLSESLRALKEMNKS